MGLSKEPNIGDRFERGGDTYEYLGDSLFKNITLDSQFHQFASTNVWSFNDENFIGNFAKSRNFSNLYDILNDEKPQSQINEKTL